MLLKEMTNDLENDIKKIISSMTAAQLEKALDNNGYKGMKIEKSKFEKFSKSSPPSAIFVVEFKDDGSTDNKSDLKGKIFVTIDGFMPVAEF